MGIVTDAYLTPRPHCAATTLAGAPCRGYPVAGGDRCYQHSTDPEVVAARSESRARGGRSRATTRHPEADGPLDARRCLQRAQTDAMNMPPGAASVRALCKVAELIMQRTELDDLAQTLMARLAALEAHHDQTE